NSAGADQTLRIINPGTVGTPMSPNEGFLCADIYVFDNTQEMSECCSCPVSANGLLELSINNDLLANPLLVAPPPNSGVIKVISDAYSSGCGNVTGPNPAGFLLAWQTHIQQPTAGTFVTTEDEYQFSPLRTDGGPKTTDELAFLGTTCAF